MPKKEKCQIYSKWVNRAFSIAVQVFLIFCFLSLFFFLYVVVVEKEVFEEQVNLIVDDIMKDIDLQKILPPVAKDKKEELLLLSSGILAVIEEKIRQESGDPHHITQNNNALIDSTGKVIIYFAGGVVVISVALMVLGFCLPVTQQLIESLVAVFFVALTEFVFLNVVVRNYISASPNQVRRLVAIAIQKYVAHREHLS